MRKFVETALQNITSYWQFTAPGKQKSFQSSASLLCNLCKSVSTTEMRLSKHEKELTHRTRLFEDVYFKPFHIVSFTIFVF